MHHLVLNFAEVGTNPQIGTKFAQDFCFAFILYENVKCLVDSYEPPCPNGGSDVTYLLRYLVKKYLVVNIVGNPNSIAVFDGDVSPNTLTISIPLIKYEGIAVTAFFCFLKDIFQSLGWFAKHKLQIS